MKGRRKRVKLLVLIVMIMIGGGAAVFIDRADSRQPDQQESASMPNYEGTVYAPEFPSGMQWLNTDHPLTLHQLRGKVVLLDFWTYCCINCMHILPDLKKLEQKYRNELVVIGIHSAKFTTEKGTENIRQAILRYEIEHPVINDKDMIIWRQYTVRSWPTVFLINPLGKVIGYASGEGVYDTFDHLIGEVIKEFDKQGRLNRKGIQFHLERDGLPTPILSFPGKVLADEASKRLFIADSNHNRIVVASLTGFVKDVIGKGEIGLDDGSFEQATFHHPQGMALDGDILYVADTENHALRRVDLEKRNVTTLAGTGEQAGHFNVVGMGKRMLLNSPWDLVLHDGSLYIAMAGPHQLWKMELKTGQIGPYAGSGREARVDGPLRQAALAQPSGITTDGKKLYFADSEVSSIRSADLDPKGRVETIVGLDLFEFGDRDGTGSKVRLQHPLGVVYQQGVLYVADTYNNKIKKIVPQSKSAVTFLGTGKEGLRDGSSPLFDEPGGVSAAGDKLYIADTNNHVIRVADLNTKMVTTLELKGIEKLRRQLPLDQNSGDTISLEPQSVAPGARTVTLSLELPKGYKLNAQAPSHILFASDGKIARLGNGETKTVVQQPQFPLTIPIQLEEGRGEIRATLVLYYCEAKKQRLCYFREAHIRAPIMAVPGSHTETINLHYTIQLGR